MDRPFPRLGPLVPATFAMLACSGCGMLGSLADAEVLRWIVVVVVVVAAIGFLVSRSEPRR